MPVEKGQEKTPAVAGHASCCCIQRRAWSIDSNHASQPTLRLDNFLLSRTLESGQVCQVSCGRKLNFSFQRGSDVQTSGFLWCPVFTNMRNTKEGHKWGLSEMESSEQTHRSGSWSSIEFPGWVLQDSVSSTLARADTSSIGRRLQGVMTSDLDQTGVGCQSLIRVT